MGEFKRKILSQPDNQLFVLWKLGPLATPIYFPNSHLFTDKYKAAVALVPVSSAHLS